MNPRDFTENRKFAWRICTNMFPPFGHNGSGNTTVKSKKTVAPVPRPRGCQGWSRRPAVSTFKPQRLTIAMAPYRQTSFYENSFASSSQRPTAW